MAVKFEQVSYKGWPNCLRLTNGKIEIIVTTDVGPRIIRFGKIGGQNFMKEYPQYLGKMGGKDWCIYGGHRLWHAPEISPRTYAPDNTPVDYRWDSKSIKLFGPAEPTTGIAKEIRIEMHQSAAQVTLTHKLINRNMWAVELAPWTLSVLAPGGRAIIPQEQFRPHPEYFLPARPLVLWHYTNMADKRWIWGEKYIQLTQDPKAKTKQKLGLYNTRGWAAYALKNQLMVKRYNSIAAPHTDFGCNTEIFTDSDMLELETLGPLTKIQPGSKVEHVERWSLYDVKVGTREGDIDKKVLPLLK